LVALSYKESGPGDILGCFFGFLISVEVVRMAEFRKVLYYPYIHVKDDAWLKTAALFYDRLCRINPDPAGHSREKPSQDSDSAKALMDEFGFIEDVPPAAAAKLIEVDYQIFANEQLANPQTRAQYNPELSKPLGNDEYIHVSKVSSQLAGELEGLGLLRKSGQKDWYQFDPAAAATYMTFLAKETAAQLGISVVTDDPAYQPFLFRAMGPAAEGRGTGQKADNQLALASLIIKDRLPDPSSVADASIEEIIKFRKKHDDERRLFMDEIREQARTITASNSGPALRQQLEEKNAKVQTAIKGYRKSLKASGIKFGASVVGLSIPAWVSCLSTLTPHIGIPVAVGSLLVGGVYTVATKGSGLVEFFQIKGSSPWSYVHAIERRFGKGKQFQTIGLMERIRL
jgi:hypothetical protein